MLNTYKIPDKSILQLVSTYDACETLQLTGKWPRSYSCVEEVCPKCGGKMSLLAKRQQKNTSDKKLLISKLHVIVIDIYSKKCRNCYIIRSPDTLQFGLLNIGDVTLVSIDVFFTLRNTVR